MPNFLLEIGTEELPAGFITPALQSLVESFSTLLRENNLSFSNVKTLGTPRRLTVFVDDLPLKQPDQTKEINGPREGVAFDPSGKPTKALIGFARRYQLKPDEVKLKDTPKGKVCYVLLKSKGEHTKKLLPTLAIQAIRQVSSFKSMWWAEKSVSFSRPIRSFTALLGKDALKIELADIKNSNQTQGHYLIDPRPITLRSANLAQYKKLLKKSFVIIDQKERRNKVIREIDALLKRHGSMVTNRDIDLVDEVTNMLEYPTAIKGEFIKEFLNLPESVLTVALKKQQHYFPVYNKAGKLQPYFILLANNTKRNSSLIREGNERVLRARLTDAMFFWQRDQKVNWVDRLDQLKEIGFLRGLGSFVEKVQRIKYLCGIITNDLNSPQETRHQVIRAAELCKFDLLTEMVGEFPELQGLMGYEYMRLQGEPKEVALAIKEHYQPRFQQDQLPRTVPGIILSLADKFDNLCSCFTMGLKPSGSQDPYALRRQVLGIIKIILENKLNLSLKKVIRLGIDQVIGTIHSLLVRNKITPDKPEVIYEAINSFIEDRLYQMCLEQDYPHDLIRATLACGFDHLPDFKLRLETLVRLKNTKSWPDLITVVERTHNIGKNVDFKGEAKPDLFRTPEEAQIWKLYQANKPQIQMLIDEKKYYDASLLYARAFAEPVHKFFDKVFVNVEDMDLRRNRIVLMKQLNRLYSTRIADLSTVSQGLSSEVRAR